MAGEVEDGSRGGLSVCTVRGLVALASWQGGELIEAHRMTPAKARKLAEHLVEAADKADAEMPKIGE